MVDSVEDAVLGPPEGITYPDLIPDVTNTYVDYTFTHDPVTNTFTPHPMLYFDTWAQNLGTVPLDLVSDDLTNVVDPPVSQCVSWSGKICRERQSVGGFVVHPAHGHMHFDDFASYELRSLLPDGTPDYSASGRLGASDKVSFCLVDSWRVRDDADQTATYAVCNAAREGISAGWSDVYGADLEGQNISIDGLPDGQYGIVIDLNPSRHVYETTYTNNKVVVTVNIDSTGEWPEATIVARSYPS